MIVSDVQIGQGQTVNLGTIDLTPVDDKVSSLQVTDRNWDYVFLGLLFIADGANSGATGLKTIFQEYIAGPAVAQPFQVLGTIDVKNYTYTRSTASNPTVPLTDEKAHRCFYDQPNDHKRPAADARSDH